MAQGYNSRLDESLGARNGKKKQSFKDRRDESKAMSKKMYGHSYGADKGMSYRHSSSWKRLLLFYLSILALQLSPVHLFLYS